MRTTLARGGTGVCSLGPGVARKRVPAALAAEHERNRGVGEVHLGHIKLAVDDIDRGAVFYREACGLVVFGPAEATMNGRAGIEVMFAPTVKGGPMLVLVRPHDESAPQNDDILLEFMSGRNFESFCAWATATGGRAMQAIRSIPEHGVKVAFIADVDGNALEVLEVLPVSRATGSGDLAQTSCAELRRNVEHLGE